MCTWIPGTLASSSFNIWKAMEHQHVLQHGRTNSCHLEVCVKKVSSVGRVLSEEVLLLSCHIHIRRKCISYQQYTRWNLPEQKRKTSNEKRHHQTCLGLSLQSFYGWHWQKRCHDRQQFICQKEYQVDNKGGFSFHWRGSPELLYPFQ